MEGLVGLRGIEILIPTFDCCETFASKVCDVRKRSLNSQASCLIVEVPNSDPQFVASSELRPRAEKVRDFIKTKLLRDQEPSPRGSVMQHLTHVTVTGQLFYDDAHVGDQLRGKKGCKAATL